MKILLLPVLCILCLNMNAQLISINSVQVIPANPSSTDTLRLIADCTFSSGDCSMLSSGIQVASGGILVNGNYCPGMLTFICTSVDTLTIGALLPGNYTINFAVNLGTSPMCNQFSPAGNTSVSINVTGPTGMNENILAESNFIIEKGSGYGNFVLSTNSIANNWILKIYNVDGKIVFQKQITNPKEELKLQLGSGVYLYKLEREGKSTPSKKLLVL